MPALLVISLNACENTYWSCLRGNGIIEQETRQLQPYDGVVTEGAFEITYVYDSLYYMIVETDQNLIPYIRSRISGNTLIIDNGTRKCLRSEYPIRINVYTPEIRLMNLTGSGSISAESVFSEELKLVIEGSGSIDIRDINVNDVQALITGSGKITLWGSSELAEYIITGSGTIEARYLEAGICVAEISGSGTIYCHAEDQLDALITGSGNIYFRGNPGDIKTNISGSGSVLSID